MERSATDAGLAKAERVGVSALWPWALFSAALLVGLASFFIHTPR